MGSGIFDLLITDGNPNYQFSDRYTDLDTMLAAITRTIRHHIQSGQIRIEIEEVEK